MYVLSVFLAALTLFQTAAALGLTIPAEHNPKPRCIRDFVAADTLVVVNIKTNGHHGDGQRMSITIQDMRGNQYAFRESIGEYFRQAFTPSQDTAFDICFANTLTGTQQGQLSRQIDLEVEIGAHARDWNALQASEKLKPVELDIRRVDEICEEVQKEFNYLLQREHKLRDTNESTNRRVKNFFVITVLSFVCLGVWQIQYLRAYFRSKHII